MARAHSVYLVSNQQSEPVAAFTVKHECISWCRRVAHSDWTVTVIPDGGGTPRLFQCVEDFAA